MKLEGTPQELVEFLMTVIGGEKPDIKRDASGNSYIAKPTETIWHSTRSIVEEMTRSER